MAAERSGAQGGGEPFGRYRLVREIGRGGMAQVHLAHQVGPQGFVKPCVIKRINPELAVHPPARAMFLEEARVTALLNHPNIVQTFDLGEVNGFPYMAMELVDGVNLALLLRTLAKNGRWIPLRASIEICLPLLQALEYAHNLKGLDGRRLNLVHRDVSPHNVLISRQGVVKLADFGIARHDARAEVTKGLVAKGKPGYMAPEQAMAQQVDARADVFSTGLVLAELVSARRAVRSERAIQDLVELERRVPRLCSLQQDMTPELSSVIAKMTKLEADQRISSAAHAIAELEAAAATIKDERGLAPFVRKVFQRWFPEEGGEGVPAPAAEEATVMDLAPPSAPSGVSDLVFERAGWDTVRGASAAIAAKDAGKSSEKVGEKNGEKNSEKDAGKDTPTDADGWTDGDVGWPTAFRVDPAEAKKPPLVRGGGPPKAPQGSGLKIGRDAAARRGAAQAEAAGPSLPAASPLSELEPRDARKNVKMFQPAAPARARSPLVLVFAAVLGIGGYVYLTRSTEKKLPTHGTVRVTSVRSGAEILVDGVPTPYTTPHELDEIRVELPVTISVALPGHVPVPREIELKLPAEQPAAAVSFVLEPARAFRVDTKPSGASIVLDGRPLGQSPVALPDLQLGTTATLTVTLAGHFPERRRIRVTPDAPEQIAIELRPGEPLDVLTEPTGARIFVDGVAQGSAPLFGLLVPRSGRAKIRAELAGYAPAEVIASGDVLKRRRLELTLSPRRFSDLPLRPAERRELRARTDQLAHASGRLAVARRDLERAERALSRVRSDPRALLADAVRAEGGVEAARAQVEHAEAVVIEAQGALDKLRDEVTRRLESSGR